MSTTSPSCWLLHQDRFFQPGQYMGQPAAEILSKAVAMAPDRSFSQHSRGHGYHDHDHHHQQSSSTRHEQQRQTQKATEPETDVRKRPSCESTDVVDGAQGQSHGGGHHAHGDRRRSVSASLRGFFRHGPRHGGASWIELE